MNIKIGKLILSVSLLCAVLVGSCFVFAAEPEEKIASVEVDVDLDLSDNCSEANLRLWNDQSSHAWTVYPGNNSKQFQFLSIVELTCHTDDLADYALNLSEVCLRDRESILAQCTDEGGVTYQARLFGCEEKFALLDQHFNDSKDYEQSFVQCSDEKVQQAGSLSSCVDDRDSFKVQRFIFGLVGAALVFGVFQLQKRKRLPGYGPDRDFPGAGANLPDLQE